MMTLTIREPRGRPFLYRKTILETVKCFSIHILYKYAVVNQVTYYNSKRKILHACEIYPKTQWNDFYDNLFCDEPSQAFKYKFVSQG